MAYQMQYDNFQIIHSIPREKKKTGKKAIYFIAIAIIILCLLMIPEVSQLLIPGNAEVTKMAADEMLRQIRSGEGVVDAFTQFCLEILHSS